MYTYTLVVHGEHDPLVPRRWAEEVTSLLPQGQLATLPHLGHALNYSAPVELVRVTQAFLEITKPYTSADKQQHENPFL